MEALALRNKKEKKAAKKKQSIKKKAKAKKKKKQQKDDHVILVNENRPGMINICLYYWMCFLCGSLGTEE